MLRVSRGVQRQRVVFPANGARHVCVPYDIQRGSFVTSILRDEAHKLQILVHEPP